jgi:hypothetical protein
VPPGPGPLAAGISLALALAAGAVETQLKSPAFGHGQPIPKRHTCDGGSASVPLIWPNPPKGTRGFVIIAEDPTVSAGSVVHWIVYDLPAGTRRLPAALPARPSLRGGGKQGKTGLGKVGYAAPCPDPGRPHQYWFRIYAVDQPLGLPSGASAAEVRAAMRKHVLWVAELMGTYARPTPPLPR